REIDRALRGRHAEASARNVKLGRGGIREVEFLVQALQLLYGGDDPWLRERNSLKALFRLTERGYLAPDLGRRLSHALVHLRTVEHRLQILHEFQTHTLPDDPFELGRLARRVGIDAPPRVAARGLRRAARRPARAARRAREALRRRRPPGAAAGRSARAALVARRPERARGPAHARRLSCGARAGVRAGARRGGAARPAATDQAGAGIDRGVALPVRRHGRRSLLARDDRAGRGQPGRRLADGAGRAG